MKYYEVKFSLSAPAELMGDVSDVVVALAGEAGFETFEENDDDGTLVGYVRQDLFSAEQLDAQLALMPYDGNVKVSYNVSEAEDKDWNEQWEQEGFQPIVVDDRVVIHDGRHLPELLTGDPALTTVEIDAHLAFGTGNHETTRLMIAHLLRLDLTNARLLDCGTGTGILAITALKLGVHKAVGYDIDEWSVDNARHNAVINGVDDRFESLLGDAQHVFPTLNGPFDVVTANINRNILLNDMSLFVSQLATGGHLLLSGFYRDDLPLIVDCAQSLGLHLTHQSSEGEWQSCCLQRR